MDTRAVGAAWRPRRRAVDRPFVLGDPGHGGRTDRGSSGWRNPFQINDFPASEVFHKAWYAGSRSLRYDGAFAPRPFGFASGCVVDCDCRRGRSAQRFEMEAVSVRTSRFVLSLVGLVILGLASPVYAQEATANA